MIANAFAGIAASFSAAVGAPFHDAVARWPGTPVLDDGGSITTPGTPVALPCLAQVDNATEAMRSEAGFVSTDVRLLVLALSGGLDTDATVEVLAGPRAGTYSVQSVGGDPAGVGHEARGRAV